MELQDETVGSPEVLEAHPGVGRGGKTRSVLPIPKAPAEPGSRKAKLHSQDGILQGDSCACNPRIYGPSTPNIPCRDQAAGGVQGDREQEYFLLLGARSSSSSSLSSLKGRFIQLHGVFGGRVAAGIKGAARSKPCPSSPLAQHLAAIFLSQAPEKTLGSKTRHRERKQQLPSPSKANYPRCYTRHPFPPKHRDRDGDCCTFPGASHLGQLWHPHSLHRETKFCL